MGTARFLVWMTALVIIWVTFNIVGISQMHFDPYPFILLNLFFSILASYSAPLVLLAQNRQEARDRLILDEDRQVAAQARADMDFLAREVASIRMGLGEVATRDFIRSELRAELRELVVELDRREATTEAANDPKASRTQDDGERRTS